MKTENVPCVKVEKRRGEEVRRALRELDLLRTDAKIPSNRAFVYFPLIRTLTEAERKVIGSAELLQRDVELLEPRLNIENIVGFRPSFEIIGDIAVLTDDSSLTEPTEQLVAQAILTVHKNIKVVAKRISPVEGVFRKRKLRILAGEHRTETLHKENECRYKLDLEKVYFNPRLAAERTRVAAQAERSGKEEIIDMFAGVGPFALQIAKRAPQSHVTAIDINPDAIGYLQENKKLNGVENVDALVGDVKVLSTEFKNTADRIIMNLPKSAYSFLHEALSLLKPEGGILHFYDLASLYPENEEKKMSLRVALDRRKEAFKARIKELGEEFHVQSIELLNVRKVKAYAPYMYIIGIDAHISRGLL
jgi:tRNA (guanine37-N1)-methyltransferase